VATVAERLDAHDAILATVQEQLEALLGGQADAASLIERRANEAREHLRVEAESQRQAVVAAGQAAQDEIANVNKAVVQIATNMITLQQQVTKWAAAASLAGAVVLFIAVRALGF
jgi:hypothetical protein